MIEEFEAGNLDNPFPDETFTAAQAIEAVNRLLWSEDVEDDNYEDARVIKAFLVGTLPNIPVPVKHSKTIPVMETTIEGAQKRIAEVIEWYDERSTALGVDFELDYIAVFLDSVGDEMAAISSSCNSLHARYVEALANANQLQADFDTVDAEAAGHLADKIELQKEIDRLREEREDLLAKLVQANDDATALRQANLNNLHAAHDNR